MAVIRSDQNLTTKPIKTKQHNNWVTSTRNATTTSSTTGTYITTSSASGSYTTAIDVWYDSGDMNDDVYEYILNDHRHQISREEFRQQIERMSPDELTKILAKLTTLKLTSAIKIHLKDGSVIDVDATGNYKILDNDAKVTYKANRQREFNKYVNASDLLEDFIKDLGKLGARQKDVLDTPIELFITWLILRAAEQDGDVSPDLPKLESQINKQPHCKFCGRFIKNALVHQGFNFCNPFHAERHFNKLIPQIS